MQLKKKLEFVSEASIIHRICEGKGQSIQLDQTLKHSLNLNKYNPGRLELDMGPTLQGVLIRYEA